MADKNFPNNLRAERKKAFLSRAALCSLTHKLAEVDQLRFRKVSIKAVEKLERGESMPHPQTASALAEALGHDPLDVFPLGPFDRGSVQSS
jgi:transcriptional regulator with XRE-family HTH domain